MAAPSSRFDPTGPAGGRAGRAPDPVTVTVSGAVGQIGCAVIFRMVAGEVFGPGQPVALRLLEVPKAMGVLEGIAMEVEDTASSLLASLDLFDASADAFSGATHIVLAGAHPRVSGMTRAALLERNAPIFVEQGRAINRHAADGVRVTVVGNPANTNALVAATAAPDIPRDRFTAVTRLDHNRALYQLARHLGVSTGRLTRMTVWGNHSDSQVPDIEHVLLDGERLDSRAVDTEWLEGVFLPTVAQRGAAIIAARGQSSSASAASAVVDHLRDEWFGTSPGDWTSAGVVSRGEYGVPAGLVCSMPVTAGGGGGWRVVEGLDLSARVRARLRESVRELEMERDAALTASGAARG